MNKLQYYKIEHNYDNHWLQSDTCDFLRYAYKTKEDAENAIKLWLSNDDNMQTITPDASHRNDSALERQATNPEITVTEFGVSIIWKVERRLKEVFHDVKKTVIVDGVEYSTTVKELVTPASEWEPDFSADRYWREGIFIPAIRTMDFYINSYELEWWPQSKEDNT